VPTLVERLTHEGSVRFWTVLSGIATVLALLFSVALTVTGDGDPSETTASVPSETPSPKTGKPTKSPGAVKAATPTNAGAVEPAKESTPTSLPSASVVSTADPEPRELGDPLDSQGCGAFGWRNRGPATIAGVDYPSSLLAYCEEDADVVWMDFLVPIGATLLTGIAGIDDHSTKADGKATFSILDTSGDPLVRDRTLAYGESWSLSVPVDEVRRIRLQIQFKHEGSGGTTAGWAGMKFRR